MFVCIHTHKLIYEYVYVCIRKPWKFECDSIKKTKHAAVLYMTCKNLESICLNGMRRTSVSVSSDKAEIGTRQLLNTIFGVVAMQVLSVIYFILNITSQNKCK